MEALTEATSYLWRASAMQNDRMTVAAASTDLVQAVLLKPEGDGPARARVGESDKLTMCYMAPSPAAQHVSPKPAGRCGRALARFHHGKLDQQKPPPSPMCLEALRRSTASATGVLGLSYRVHSPSAARRRPIIAVREVMCRVYNQDGVGRPGESGPRTDPMSASASNAAIINAYNAELTFNYCVYAALTLVCHEFIITFEYEYEFLWRRKWTAATWLFIVNRYLLLASIIPQATPVSMKVVFSALRVFALLDHGYLTAGCVFVLGVAPMGIQLYSASQLKYSPFGSFLDPTCSLNLATSLSSIAADIVAIVITWVKTYRHVRQAGAVGMNAGFGATLLQYGTLYFVVIFVVFLLDFLLFIIPRAQSAANQMSTFATVIPNIILSRFLIGLRKVDPVASIEASRFSVFSSPNFRIPTLPDIIGNLGEPLEGDNQAFTFEEHEEDVDSFKESSHTVLASRGIDIEGASAAPYISSDDVHEVRRTIR
ncbi:hypothetical protein NM688_g5064 [Phlebia brevispora]|uniref:Uncharacterized protein n=1 Tax=Phlebia brevispora TaxID=194682 RepID=A0ACC1T1B0_9APHY|nr:hypothetical protein NM688_g5064 [Phlebia brevispora]